jgi:isoleucyl-tRNA synthetase
MIWLNVYSYFVTYANEAGWKPDEMQNAELRIGLTDSLQVQNSGSILDKWIVAGLNETIADVTKSLDKYDVLSASRKLDEFIDGLSTWYLRRSRHRFSSSADGKDRNQAFHTLYYVLIELSKIMAPFTPFTAEVVYKGLTNESVHLSQWPMSEKPNVDVLEKMSLIRKVISNGLDARMQAGVKIRQELGQYHVSPKIEALGIEYLEILQAELNIHVNVPELNSSNVFVKVGEGDEYIGIDPTITPELEARGFIRELVRFVQDWRKKNGMTVSDKASVVWQSDDVFVSEILGNLGNIEALSVATRTSWVMGEVANEPVEINGYKIYIKIGI